MLVDTVLTMFIHRFPFILAGGYWRMEFKPAPGGWQVTTFPVWEDCLPYASRYPQERAETLLLDMLSSGKWHLGSSLF